MTVVGAEQFVTYDDEPGIRIYYDFTNNSEYTTSSWMELDFDTEQDGVEAEYTGTLTMCRSMAMTRCIFVRA